MVILFVFALGVGNFALHQAVLDSRHPLLAQMAWLIDRFGGRGSLVLEFLVLLAAMMLVAAGYTAGAWVYLGYSAFNVIAAWLVLSGRL